MVVTYHSSLMMFMMKCIHCLQIKTNHMCFWRSHSTKSFVTCSHPNYLGSLSSHHEDMQQPPLLVYSWFHLSQLHVPDQSSSSQILICSFCIFLALTWKPRDLEKQFSILNEDWKGRLGGMDVSALEISNSSTYQIPELLTLPSHFSDSFPCTCIFKIPRFQM